MRVGDIEIATDNLRGLATKLSGMHADLMSTDAKAGYSTSTLAHHKVVGAMEEFRDNWNDNRKYVADKLNKLSELADQTAEGFEQVDQKLAQEINEAMKG